MRRTLLSLAVLLVLQVGAVLILALKPEGLEESGSEEKLVSASLSSLDKIVIESKEEKGGSKTLTLLKKDGEWQLPEAHGFPVSEKKLKDLETDLLGAKRGWPIAETAAAAKRFRLTDKDFERKLSLYESEKLKTTLYLGSSPSFRKVHVRLADSDLVFAVDYSAYDAAVEPTQWYDRDVFKLPGTPQAVAVGDLRFEQKDGKLVLSDLKEGEDSNEEEVKNLVSKLTAITFSDVIGSEPKEKYEEKDSVLKVSLKSEKGEDIVYDFRGPLDENAYAMKSSSESFFVRVRKPFVEELTKLKRENFVKQKEKTEEAPAPTPAEEISPADGELMTPVASQP